MTFAPLMTETLRLSQITLDWRAQDFGPPAKQVPRERTNELVGMAYEAQVRMVLVGISSRVAIEDWFSALLQQHWEFVLNFPAEAKEVAFRWSEQVAGTRFSVLHRGKADGSIRGKTAPSDAGIHLEQWFCRYVAQTYPPARQQKVFARAIAPLGLAAGGEVHQRLLDRLSGCAESSSRWRRQSAEDVARGLVMLIHYELIAQICDHLEKSNPFHADMRRLMRQYNDVAQELLLVNHGGIFNAALKFQRAGADLSLGMDELQQSARLAAVFALGQFSPQKADHSFATACLTVVESRLKREITKARGIRIPHDKAKAVRQYMAWSKAYPHLANTLSMEAQIEAAGIKKISVDALLEAIESDRNSATISLEGMTAGSDQDSWSDSRANFAHDRGENADRSRASLDGDPRSELIRSAYASLNPLHRAVLSAFAPCAATDGGEDAWLISVGSTGAKVLSTAVNRISAGKGAVPVEAIQIRFK